MTEFDFIRQYLNRQQQDAQLLLGIGDDAALIRPHAEYDLCFSSDMLLKNRHFFSDVSPEDLAWKVLAVNLSDMAAMGARPRWALLSAALPELDAGWLQRFCDSFFALAQRFGVVLIGGDTTKGDLVFNITIIGELPRGRSLRRDAAQVGDDIWVSGELGLAAAALQHHLNAYGLDEALWPLCQAKLLRPEPRVALGLKLLPIANAGQDISDGLLQDIGHILAASGVGAELWADRLPVPEALKQQLSRQAWLEAALAGGDDYELLFTAPQNRREDILAVAEEVGVAVARIGVINHTAGLKIMASDGQEITLTSKGFDHFG